jgi:hypothetical protein
MVLPLRLVPFESYMLADDRPAFPMNVLLRFRFSGRFDRPTLETAVAAAVSRHPLLAAVARRSGHRWIWEPAGCLPGVRWLDALPGEALPALRPLDVRVEPGLQVALCEGSGRTDLILRVHHACCDAGGYMAFAEDLLAAYAIARGVSPAAALRPLRPECLEGRGRFPWTAPSLFDALARPCVALARVWRFLGHSPDPLIPHRPAAPDDSVPSDYPAIVCRRLDVSQTAEVLAVAKGLGVTLNDLLTRDLFLALAGWRQQVVPGRQDAWLRVCIPVSLRTSAHDQLPAANVVSMVFLDRRGRDLADPGTVLKSIHDHMQRTRRFGLGPVFVRSVGVCQWLPSGLERACRPDRCRSTVVFTNLGVLFRGYPLSGEGGRVAVDDLVLQEVDVSAPLRPLTCAAFSVLSYAGSLGITLHYDSRVLAPSQAVELIDGFVDRVRRSAA